MKWWRVVGVILLTALLPVSDVLAEQFAFFVRFTDKNPTTYSLSSPSAYLSPRAITRRTLQGIPIDSTDLPVCADYVDSVLTLTGGKLHGTSKWMNAVVVLVRDSTDMHSIDGKPYIKDRRFIAYYTDSLHRTFNDDDSVAYPLPVAKQTADPSVYFGLTWTQTALVHGDALNTDGHLGDGMLIAVMDGGFQDADTHPALASMWSESRMVDKHNFVLANESVFAYDVHGTKALGTMAGNVPNTYVGSAPKASYALYVTEDGNSEQIIELVNMLMATEHADSIGADVISTSLGYNTFTNPADNFVYATDFDGKSTYAAIAANTATSKGMLFVATAGNEGGNDWNMILTPGDADSALTIGNVDASGNAAFNSGYGPNAAGQIKPDVCGMGQVAAVLSGAVYGTGSGTSFSTPQIAGWAACLWQVYPAASPYQLRQAIIRCASLYTTPEPHRGYGIADFDCAMRALKVPIGPRLSGNGNIFTIGQNPASDALALTVWGDQATNADFILTDAAGRQVWKQAVVVPSGGFSNVSVNLTGFADGIYILRAVAGNQVQVARLLHQ